MAGRPSKYKPQFAEQARKLTLLGATDRELAEVLDRYSEDRYLATWLKLHREDRHGVIAVLKRQRAASRRIYRQSPSAKIRNAMSARIWAALKGRTDGALFSRLGYSAAELKEHLEKRFQPGMNWLNYGKWHVDHIKPCALFDQSNPSQFAECWALSNLQPLWALANCKKGASYGSP